MMLAQPRPCLLLLIMISTMIGAPGLLLAQENSVPDEPTLIVRITPPKPYLQEEIVQVIRVIAPPSFRRAGARSSTGGERGDGHAAAAEEPEI